MRKIFRDAIELFRVITFNPVQRTMKPRLVVKETSFLNLGQVRELLSYVKVKSYDVAIIDLRKIRVGVAERGKGKRGGFRVIYLDLPRIECTHLLALYGKDEKEDISSDEKKVLKTLVDSLKKER